MVRYAQPRTLLLRAYDYRHRARNRGFLVGRRAVLRLRLNIIEAWTTYAAGITSCTGAESGDVPRELAAGIPGIHGAVDVSLGHRNAHR
jgi:hypothetical protein